MKFFGTPNMLVKKREKKPFSMEYKFVPLFRFDQNGEYVTDDEKLIERLKRKFKYKENVPSEGINQFHCKKCDFTTDSNGKLMAHYRKEHPKK